MKRQIDKVGRITIPVDYREELNLDIGDYVQIEMQDNKIILTKVDEEKEHFKQVLINRIDELKSLDDIERKEEIYNIIDLIQDNL